MNERTIFLAALEKDDSQERNSFLDAACGEDTELRNSVEELIRAHNDAGSFLEKPPVEIEPAATVVFEDIYAVDSQQVDLEHIADPTNIETTTSDELDLSFLEPCDKPDTLGRLGSYEITAVIGRGGMGVVLKGRDPELNRVVAIKVLAPELASNALARKRFLREARAAAAISHDHVVTIHAINQTGQLPHLAMEYVDGESLQQRLDRSGPLELKEILRIGKQTAAGLAAAHAEGLIHRDIKPANILLENGVERVKITDFGLARAVDDVSLTQTGVVAGTPQYMSPEQAQGQRVDHRADLFSLGSVLYAMCTGRPPFRADSTIAVIRRVCDDTPRPIPQVNPDIPGWLVAIIDKLLAKDPNERFESATEVAELLGQHLAHIQQPSLVRRPVPVLQTADRSKPGHATRRSTKQRWAAAAILLLVLFGGLSFTEATGLTQVTSTVIRIVTGEGTLVVEVVDPEVSIQIDGEELIITGAGVREIRIRPGKYRIQALKNGKPVHQELVTITRNGRTVVRMSLESEVPDVKLVSPIAGQDGWVKLFNGR
ncbi:MAG: serine/threonine protein kinase, partial [Planctomycetes bacterium]|nr:serine/threonine protein kinase [Planctomycetota bacterium]